MHAGRREAERRKQAAARRRERQQAGSLERPADSPPTPGPVPARYSSRPATESGGQSWLYVLLAVQALGTVLIAVFLYSAYAARPEQVRSVGQVQERVRHEPARPVPAETASYELPGSPAGIETAGLPHETRLFENVQALVSPRLELRDGLVIRGGPVVLRGEAPYGSIVALKEQDRTLAVSVVEAGSFRFDDVRLSGGSHTLSVVALSTEGPAVESPPVTVRYEP